MNSGQIHLLNIVPSVNIGPKGGLGHVPYGIVYVGSYLKKHGHDVKLHHFNEHRIEEKTREIAGAGPLWVGLSVLSGLTTYYSALFSKKLKSISDTKIVWGGHHPSLMSEQTLRQDYVDFVCMGFGEETARELTDFLLGNRGIADVSGIGHEKDGEIVLNRRQSFEKEIDRYTLEWSLLNLDDYTINMDDGKKGFSIFSSRGCPYNCAFCSTREYSGTFWTGHSVEYLMNAVDALEGRMGNISILRFSDDNVMLNKKRGYELLSKLKARGIAPDSINIRLDQLTPEMIGFLKEHGVKSIFFGWESGSPRVLKVMNKKITPELIRERVSFVRDARISAYASGILGVPTETESDVRKNIAFAAELWKLLYEGTVSLFRFMPLPGTELSALAIKDGFKVPSNPEEWRKIDPQSEFYEMPWLRWMTPAKLKKLWMTQKFIREHMPKRDYSRLGAAGRAYFAFWAGINLWRLKRRFFAGVALQEKIEGVLHRVAVSFKSLSGRKSQ